MIVDQRLFDERFASPTRVLFVLHADSIHILHERQGFICKALKGEAIVGYAEPFITPQMEASVRPLG